MDVGQSAALTHLAYVSKYRGICLEYKGYNVVLKSAKRHQNLSCDVE